MTSTSKIIFGSLALGVILFVGYFAYQVLAVVIAFGGFDGVDKTELIENYHTKDTEILALKDYFNSIVPEGYEAYIEYSDEDIIDLWVFKTTDLVSYPRVPLFQQWGINPYDYHEEPAGAFDSTANAPNSKSLAYVKEQLNWNDQTFRDIKKHLDQANCISIWNGDPATIGFARSGMGKYFYKVFTGAIPDSLTSQWNDGCNNILYNTHLVLTYEGGAVGPQCFPDP